MTMSNPVLFPVSVGRPDDAVAGPVRTEMHMDIVTVGLPGGRCLRLAAMDGMLLLGDGFDSGSPLRSIVQGLAIPLETWPAVRRALDELAAG
jgi:hypothetical protein